MENFMLVLSAHAIMKGNVLMNGFKLVSQGMCGAAGAGDSTRSRLIGPRYKPGEITLCVRSFKAPKASTLINTVSR